MSELLNGLNPVQREAAAYMGGPLLILAGAGSGKTRVLTHRVAYILEENICEPWQILVVTFTNKAAREMRERVSYLIGETTCADVWLGTFHSICVRILKREIERIGYTRDFNIIDEQDKQKLIKLIIKKLEIDENKLSPSGVIAEISKAKNNLNTVADYEKAVYGDYYKEQVAKIYREYQDTIVRNNSLDFDDIIFNTIKIFKENPDCLAYYKNKFHHILVDEYQDTNKAQFMLISMLSMGHGNICVVGDESQSIYGFRGADISNILEFEKTYPDAKVIKLEQNYRSTKTILHAANHVINHNKSKIEKNLWTENDYGEKIEYRQPDIRGILPQKPKVHQVCKQRTDHEIILGCSADILQEGGQAMQSGGGCQRCGHQQPQRVRSHFQALIHAAVCIGIISPGSEAHKKSHGKRHQKIENPVLVNVFRPFPLIEFFR